MAFVTKDRVLETSTTTGTGTYTLAGASTGFQAFLGGVVAANDYVPYYGEDGTNWENGIGRVLASPARLERTTVLKSSNANAAVNWGAGTRNLRCGWPAELNTPRLKTRSVAGAVDVTLTQDEQRADVLVFTGALTASISVIVDATPWRWIVFNNTSGAFALTVKVSGLTGVAVAQGKTKMLYCDGTDVRDGMTDFPAASDIAAGIIEVADQAEMEAGSSIVRAVSPGRQQFHPSAVKAWGEAGVTGNLVQGHNMDAPTDTGIGVITWNITTDFSSVNYAAVPGFRTTAFNGAPRISSQTAGQLQVTVVSFAGTATDPDAHTILCSGDQA